jgi:hypothetical protein
VSDHLKVIVEKEFQLTYNVTSIVSADLSPLFAPEAVDQTFALKLHETNKSFTFIVPSFEVISPSKIVTSSVLFATTF